MSSILFLLTTANAAGNVWGPAKPYGNRKYTDPCIGEDCVNAKSFLTQIGYGIQKTTLPIFAPITNIASTGDDLLVQVLKSSDVANKLNNIKASALPIHKLEKALDPLKAPTDRLKSQIALAKTYTSEPIWRLLDGFIPQPLDSEEALTAQRREEADRQCEEAGYPQNPAATFQLEKPDSNDKQRRLAAAPKEETKEIDWTQPYPCADRDALLPYRAPTRLSGPEGLFEVGDYQQRKKFNTRFGAKPDPLLKHQLDEERKAEAGDFMARNGPAASLRQPLNLILTPILGRK